MMVWEVIAVVSAGKGGDEADCAAEEVMGLCDGLKRWLVDWALLRWPGPIA